MSIIYGASVYTPNMLETDYRSDIIGKNSEVIAAGDLLTVQSGVLSVATATQTIVGVAAKTQTMAADNQTNAKIQPAYIPASLNTLFLMGTNADMTGNATDPGTYYKITGTTGVMQMDSTSGVQTTTSRILEVVEVDPRQIGGSGSGSGLREVTVRLIKTPYYGITTG